MVLGRRIPEVRVKGRPVKHESLRTSTVTVPLSRPAGAWSVFVHASPSRVASGLTDVETEVSTELAQGEEAIRMGGVLLEPWLHLKTFGSELTPEMLVKRPVGKAVYEGSVWSEADLPGALDPRVNISNAEAFCADPESQLGLSRWPRAHGSNYAPGTSNRDGKDHYQSGFAFSKLSALGCTVSLCAVQL